MSSMGSSPEPAVPAYRKLRMPRKRPQVLGVDLNRSESRLGPARTEVHVSFRDLNGETRASYLSMSKVQLFQIASALSRAIF